MEVRVRGGRGGGGRGGGRWGSDWGSVVVGSTGICCDVHLCPRVDVCVLVRAWITNKDIVVVVVQVLGEDQAGGGNTWLVGISMGGSDAGGQPGAWDVGSD